jgi:CDP-paratose 2-epimerase
MVALSSVKPYKVPEDLGDGVDENIPLEPDEPYAASKMAQSALVMAYGRSYDLNVTVLRCSNLYGNAPCHGPRHGWLTWFCIASAIGRAIEIQGTGKQSRDMLYCTDVSSAIDAAAKNIEKTRGNVYNIGGGKSNVISVVQAVQEISKHIEISKSHAEGRKHEDMHFMTNFGKFNNTTGWIPKTSVHTGIKNIVNWAKENKEDLIKMYENAK